MNKIEHYTLPENTNRLYQEEAISSIGLTRGVADKINEIVDAINNLSTTDLEWKQTQEGIIRKGVIYMKDNLVNSLQDLLNVLHEQGFIDDRIEYHSKNLSARLDNSLAALTDDSEIIDMRVGENSKQYASAGAAVREQFKNTLKSRGFHTGATLSNLNDIEPNTTYAITDYTGILNLPAQSVGTCITISSDNNGSRGLQLYSVSTGVLFCRTFWTSSQGEKVWNEWHSTDYDSKIAECLKGNGWANKNSLSDLNEATPNSTISITDWTDILNLPASVVGTVITIASDKNGSRGIQFYAAGTGELYYRIFWTSNSGVKSWKDWNNYTLTDTKFPNLLVYPKIYGEVGKELNIYYCQLFDVIDWKAENITPIFTYTGTGARGYDDRISIIPEAAGTFTLKVSMSKLVDGQKVTTVEKSITIQVCENAKVENSKNVLFIGDSRTDYARINIYAKDQIPTLNLLGSLSHNGYKHEGRSGWCAETYCTKSERNGVINPFYNGDTFNFTYYMNERGYTKVDYVNLMFGVNSLYSETAMDYIEQMIESIHEYDSNIKITIMNEYALPFSAYYSGDLSRTMNSKYFISKVIERFGNRESENIYLLNTNLVIDDKTDWTYKTIAASQFSNETVTVIADNIHPKQSGYTKISNYWTSFFKNMEL